YLSCFLDLSSVTSSVFLHSYGLHRGPPAFPTRRSSDLLVLGDRPRRRRQRAARARLRRPRARRQDRPLRRRGVAQLRALPARGLDRKSTRLNSSHVAISYAVFCLKKKTQNRLRPSISIH